MEQLLTTIIERLRAAGALSERELLRIIDDANARVGGPQRAYTKRQLLGAYQRLKREQPALWESWHVDESLEQQLVATLRMKPQRSATGVASVTAIMKPWPCAKDCRYCPSDVRMPKSYLADEPACRRAERNFFDPYLQVRSRLTTLADMGHAVDRVELIVLGGTFDDYPPAYRRWFIGQLYAALNDGVPGEGDASERCSAWRERYAQAGISDDVGKLAESVADVQRRVDAGQLAYAEAHAELYGTGSAWDAVAAWQVASRDDVAAELRANEQAACRCVALSIETRPDAVDVASLIEARELGVTRLQLGVQSLRDELLSANSRDVTTADARRAFALARLFGFKIHAHFMLNLLGGSPEQDKRDYERFMRDAAFCPDEVKLYPCALIRGTRLCESYECGAYRPYNDEELLDVLGYAERVTPQWARISRMVRDFSTDDIVAGCKKPNMRQLVEARLAEAGERSAELRGRELRGRELDGDELALEDVVYETDVSTEHFLQWVAPGGAIAGLARLSLPRAGARERAGVPLAEGDCVLRELHVYGHGAGVGQSAQDEQQRSLGRALVARAAAIAREEGYAGVQAMSAAGMRGSYRALGFAENGLYQRLALEPPEA